MKRAFSLIELIITIVIMAGIFAAIPKIVFSTNKSDALAMKQDAMLEAISITNIASTLSWDAQNGENMDILQTTNNTFECNVTKLFRQGSYMSANGRICEQDLQASIILGSESGEDSYQLFNDIDDFNSVNINITTASNKLKYIIYNRVSYLEDTHYTTSGSTLILDLSLAATSATSTNIKRYTATVGYVGGRGKDKNITTFGYHSANIGQFTLNSRSW